MYRYLKILIFILLVGCTSENITKRIKFNKLVGEYRLDVKRTDLKSYSKNQSIFKELKLILKNDSTFVFNISVPFIYDSIGTWETGGNYIEDLNDMYYKANKNIHTQFTILYEDKGDSIFYMNSVTPKKDQEAVNIIFFKKLVK